MHRLTACVTILAALVLPSLAAAQQVDLRPKWRKDAQHRFKLEVNNASAINLTGEQGAEEKTTMKQEIGLRLRVVDAQPEADSTVELVYETIKVSVDAGDGKGAFDSTKSKGGSRGSPAPKAEAEAGTLESSFKPLVGLKLTLTVDPDGNITSIKGGEQVLPGDLTANLTQRSEMARLFGPIFSPRKGSGLVSVGESWENEDVIESALIGRFRMSTRHTLKSASEREALVAFDGEINTDSESPDSPYSVRDGVYKGSYAWGRSEGMLRRMESTQSFKVEADLGLGGSGPMSVTNESTLKVTREE